MFKTAFIGVAVSLLSACGGEATPQPVVAEPEATATDVDEPQAPTSPPAASGKRVPCVFGQDQTCNGDPSISALWGKCTESGTCECNTGFVLAASGYCEPAS